MAWRIEEQLIRGEIDNRTRGRVTGRLWFLGREEPVELDLKGNAWRDVAGHVLRFTNPTPKPGKPDALKDVAGVQRGVVGDITASRKVKVPECSMEEVMECYKARKPFPWHWGNSLYLEWHGDFNGRVVIEAAHYALELDPVAEWTMSEQEEEAQREENGRALIAFMERLTQVVTDAWPDEDADLVEDADEEALAEAGSGKGEDGDADPDDEDAPGAGEIQADAEQARMDLLLDRVQARIERARKAGEQPDFERIMDEERERLRRERGEPEFDPTAIEEAGERDAWREEMNAIIDEAQGEVARGNDDGDEAGTSFGEGMDEAAWHPLVERCSALTERIHDAIETHGWLTDDDPAEHPLREVENGVMIAGGKLAGALGSADDAAEWPPEALFAGGVLVRLKKAREHLSDALAGLTAADEQELAEAGWRAEIRAETVAILAEVSRLIAEVRAVLRDADDGPS